MIFQLSHPYNSDTVGWKGNFTYNLEPLNQIGINSHANTFSVQFHNHCGTHFDAPAHFNPRGLTLDQLPLDRFHFDHPLLLDIPKQPDELLMSSDFLPHIKLIKTCDLLLIRTETELFRTQNPEIYQQHGTGFSAEAASFLLENTCMLKAIGMDFISASAYQHHAEGIEAHQIFLGTHRADNRYICLIEDMHLNSLGDANLQHVVAAPILFAGIDSGPVTVFGYSNASSTEGHPNE